MTGRSVVRCAMANVARGQQASARDRLDHFAHDHAVHEDEVAWLEILDGHLVLGGNGLRNHERGWRFSRTKSYLRAQVERGERHKYVVARVKLQNGFRHEGSFLILRGSSQSRERIQLGRDVGTRDAPSVLKC